MSTAILHPLPSVAHDSCMTTRYLSAKQAAEHVGITLGAFTSLKNLPDPDVIIGEGPRATRGWATKTIDKWNENRPGRGNWGPKTPAKK